MAGEEREVNVERLTERRGGDVGYIGKHTRLPELENASTMNVAARRDVMQRLADYEDTGLTPEEIQEAVRGMMEKFPELVQGIVEALPGMVQNALGALRRMTPEEIKMLLMAAQNNRR